jgi:hypothetical protein
MAKAIFITDDLGPSVLWNKEGNKKIGEFQNAHNNIKQIQGVNQRDGLATWYLVAPNDTEEDKANVELIRKHPHFGKFFFEVDSMPIFNQVSNLRTLRDPNAASNQLELQNQIAEAKATAEKAKADKAVLFEKVKRFGVLSAKVQKAGGGIVQNADPAEVAEFQNLKQELEIKEDEEVIS